MSMNSFELHNPNSLKQAIALLDGKDVDNRRILLMAGGQDLLTEMKDRLVEPESVVNLKHVPGMDRIVNEAAGLNIGALVKVAEIAESAAVMSRFPALAMAAGTVGSPQIRHAGTMGGNLCQRPRCWYYRNENIICLKKGGDRCYAVGGENKYNAILGGGPSFIVHPSDTATALVALGALVTIHGPRGFRNVPLEKFFTLPTVRVRHENILQANEIVTNIIVPNSPLAANGRYRSESENRAVWSTPASCLGAWRRFHGAFRRRRRCSKANIPTLPRFRPLPMPPCPAPCRSRITPIRCR